MRTAPGKPRASQLASLQALMWESAEAVGFLCAWHVWAEGVDWKETGKRTPVRSRSGFVVGFHW